MAHFRPRAVPGPDVVGTYLRYMADLPESYQSRWQAKRCWRFREGKSLVVLHDKR